MLKKSSVRSLVFASLCAALSIVLGKLLQIPVGNSVRISFESLPVLFASLTLGPIWGALSGLVADLVGCVIMAYDVNPFVTLGAVTVGVLPALLVRDTKRFSHLYVPVLAAHAVGNMCIKSIGLYLYYRISPVLLLLRVFVSFVLSILESILLYQLLRSTHTPLWKGAGR